MAIEKVKAYFKIYEMESQVIEFAVSSATVELAAAALACAPERIAKSLTFYGEESAILIVTAGDAKVDNQKFKEHFNMKAKMLKAEDVEPLIGHAIGGVCPFGVNANVHIYLDISLKRFDVVYPAAGSANSAIALDLKSLEVHSKALGWVDVCKNW
ncbi:YbaK/EbsC family protein [Sulfurospirillum diekertiae]|uniref:Proline--tRNA ligase n=1 Tax=Sulfurospirillum diekertiae TaxID=1854492 RepID=A0A1Y0HLA8_9BACT|nr:YbaK/EbsC family protein [Sulfurospirillum diekertiae]ARU48376.1 Proline--tRNA ligase [Sulfurospirillum diekertiae]ASC93210.1 Proline--tRNA ligase [Sulfurospirillum diekertiae]